MTPLAFTWELDTRAEIVDVWEALSDTDRFNVAAGAGMSFTTEESTLPTGEVRTFSKGEVRKLGMTVRWTEEPFAFRAPRGFRIVRRFDNGPASHLEVDADLSERPEGTHIHYEVRVHPRNILMKPVIAIDLATSLKRGLDSALRALVKELDERPKDPNLGLVPPALNPEQEAYLREGVRLLSPASHADKLGALIRVAPVRAQSRISAQELALNWAMQLDDAIHLLLAATEAGVLRVRLELLCPACQVPRAPLARDTSVVHCDSCNIRYDASFPDAVVVHFAPHPRIRSADVPIACLMSPAHSRLVVARDLCDPGARVDLTVPLKPGLYQLRTLPAKGPPALLEVTSVGQSHEVNFVAGNAVLPQFATIAAPKSVTFANATQERLAVVLERKETPPRYLTAASLIAEFPRFRSICPDLPFFGDVSIYRGFALAVRVDGSASHLPALLRRARSANASLECAFATYDTIANLLADLGELSSGSFILAGIGRGAAFDREAGVVPCGPAVEEAYRIMNGVGLQAVGIATHHVTEEEVKTALAEARVVAVPAPYTSHIPISALIRQ